MAIRWLALLPALAIFVGVIFVNRVEPYVFGLPLLWFYILFCVLLTSIVLGIIYLLDPANKTGSGKTDAL